MCGGESVVDANSSSMLACIYNYFLSARSFIKVSLISVFLLYHLTPNTLCNVFFPIFSFRLCPLPLFLFPSSAPLNLPLQVPLLKEQKQRFRGVQHIHRETPVHTEGPSLRPASPKLYLVSAAGSGWVRKNVLSNTQECCIIMSCMYVCFILLYICTDSFSGLSQA